MNTRIYMEYKNEKHTQIRGNERVRGECIEET
jgi:hypothetical protein